MAGRGRRRGRSRPTRSLPQLLAALTSTVDLILGPHEHGRHGPRFVLMVSVSQTNLLAKISRSPGCPASRFRWWLGFKASLMNGNLLAAKRNLIGKLGMRFPRRSREPSL